PPLPRTRVSGNRAGDDELQESHPQHHRLRLPSRHPWTAHQDSGIALAQRPRIQPGRPDESSQQQQPADEPIPASAFRPAVVALRQKLKIAATIAELGARLHDSSGAWMMCLNDSRPAVRVTILPRWYTSRQEETPGRETRKGCPLAARRAFSILSNEAACPRPHSSRFIFSLHCEKNHELGCRDGLHLIHLLSDLSLPAGRHRLRRLRARGDAPAGTEPQNAG